MHRLRRSRWLFVLIAIMALVVVSLAVFRLDFGEREDAVLEYFSQQEDMPETFAQLTTLTPTDAIILCWWDYGRAVRDWSHRAVIEAYPSRDIWHTVGASRDFWHNMEAQIFGTWGSSERIHDLAAIFMQPEEHALPLMKKYDVSYAVAFTPDELHASGGHDHEPDDCRQNRDVAEPLAKDIVQSSHRARRDYLPHARPLVSLHGVLHQEKAKQREQERSDPGDHCADPGRVVHAAVAASVYPTSKP